MKELYADTLFELQRLFSMRLDILTEYLEHNELDIDEDLDSEENATQNFFNILEETTL